MSVANELSPDAPSRAALVIVDLGVGDAHAPPVLAALLKEARAQQVTIVHLRESDAGANDTHDLPPGEAVIVTRGASAMTASALGVRLRAAGVGSLVIAGDDRRFGAVALAREALAQGYRVSFAIDAMVEPHALDGAFARDASTWIAQWRAQGSCDAARRTHLDARLLRDFDSRVDPAHTALLLIDVQNDFCNPSGANGRRDAAMSRIGEAAARIAGLLDAARSAGCAVVHVGAEYGRHVRNTGSPYRFPSERAREGAVWSASAAIIDPARQFAQDDVEVCLPESWGRAFVDAVAPVSGEAVITKHRFSAFIGTPLETLLRAKGIRTLVVVGVTTNCCVESTVRDAAMLDFNVVVASDCVGVKDAVLHLHDASLEQIYTYFGLVQTSNEIADAWRRAGSRAS